MPPPQDPYRTLGVARTASPAEVTAAYRALVRALHPDARDEPADPARLAEVLAAYALLRDPHRRAGQPAAAPPPGPGPTAIPVRVHPAEPRHEPDIRAGPVRHHPGRS